MVDLELKSANFSWECVVLVTYELRLRLESTHCMGIFSVCWRIQLPKYVQPLKCDLKIINAYLGSAILSTELTCIWI